MLRRFAGLALVCAAVLSGVAAAQGAGPPLQLAPGHTPAPTPAPAAAARLPSNWKLVTGEPDPLSGQASRQVMTLPKVSPVIDGKSVGTALVLRCSTTVQGVQDPLLVVVFASLTGVGHFKKFSARYRFDEGPMRSFAAQSTLGKDHARAFALPPIPDFSNIPKLAKLPAFQEEIDPGIEIAGASRLRIEIDFKSAGLTFLDFNVASATQAINALGCQ